jgi:hypothetical protein
MPFNGTEGSYITLTDGSALTKLFRDTFLTDGREIKGVFFGKEKLIELLNQTDCVGIRCYIGGKVVERSNQPVVDFSMVLVGAKADESDMTGATDKVLDDGVPCPNKCGVSNPLNS